MATLVFDIETTALPLEMFDEATQVLEEIEPEEKNRKEVLRMRTFRFTSQPKSAVERRECFVLRS